MKYEGVKKNVEIRRITLNVFNKGSKSSNVVINEGLLLLKCVIKLNVNH